MTNYKSEKRYAKPGEEIVITKSADDGSYEEGDMYYVELIGEDGVAVSDEGEYFSADDYEVLPKSEPHLGAGLTAVLTPDERAQYEAEGRTAPYYKYIEGAHGFDTRGKTKDFHELLAEKKGYHTPHKEWRDMEARLDDTDTLIMIRKTKGGDVETYASAADVLILLGMLDVAKRQTIDTDLEFE